MRHASNRSGPLANSWRRAVRSMLPLSRMRFRRYGFSTMSKAPGPSPSPENEDPLAEAARAPLGQRVGGALLFIAAAVVGISTLRACRGEKTTPAPAAPVDSHDQKP
jgi:hypothetical protein